MSSMVVVFLILGVALVLFIVDRIRVDLVALLALLALLLTGTITVTEALAGFSATIVIIIAALFIVSFGLLQTGVAAMLGRLLGRLAANSEVRIIALVMGIVASLSAFMSSTGAVAMLLPAVMSVAKDARKSPAKFAMPLAFGSLIGGMLTIIGTPPNLVVSDALVAAGEAPFGFFDFTPIGLCILVVGVLFMVLIGRHLLPERAPRALITSQGADSRPSLAQMAASYALPDNLYRLRIRRNSPLIGQTCADAQLGERFHVDVLQVQAWPDAQPHPLPPHAVQPRTIFNAHDILTVKGSAEQVATLSRLLSLGIRPSNEQNGKWLADEVGLAELLIPRHSTWVGRTLREINLRSRYAVTAVAIRREQLLLHADLATLPLRFGDMVLVEGSWGALEQLAGEERDLILVGRPRQMEEQRYSLPYATTAIVIVILMLLSMSLGWLPAVTATLIAALAMVFTGCVRVAQMYTSIHWETIVLIAAMLPMATALEKSGGVQFIATYLTTIVGGYGPLALMAGIYLITTTISQFISNTATAVLIAPIAVQAAQRMDWPLAPFLMIVAIAASTSFATPIASPVNTLVMAPGGYRFLDYVKVGLPLQLLVLVLALFVIPWFFPI